MNLASRLAALTGLFIERPRVLGAMLAWPTFSITSYRMIDDLRRQGIRAACVVDVGANGGQFACAAIRLLRPQSLHAFEPLPEAVAVLRRCLGADSKVVIHPVALGSASGEGMLQVSHHRHASSLLPLTEAHTEAFPEASVVTQTKVSVATLDEELKGVDLPPPVLLKIDAQGYEPWILDGAADILARTEWVVLELSFRAMYRGEVTFLDMVELMSVRGFQFLRPVGWLIAPHSGEILQCDGLFRRRS